MAQLKFDQSGERYFETGVSKGVLQVGTTCVAWNGLTSVKQSPEGGDAQDQYADNIKYLSLRGAENIKGTIEAFYFPPEFLPCMGRGTLGTSKSFTIAQQAKSAFNFAYINQKGNDTNGTDYAEVINIIYNATCSPAELSHDTINESPQAQTFSFSFDTVPVPVDTEVVSTASNYAKFKESIEKIKPTAVVRIANEGSAEDKAFYAAIHDKIYGDDATIPNLSNVLKEFVTTHTSV